jgi:hypothetical protein
VNTPVIVYFLEDLNLWNHVPGHAARARNAQNWSAREEFQSFASASLATTTLKCNFASLQG